MNAEQITLIASVACSFIAIFIAVRGSFTTQPPAPPALPSAGSQPAPVPALPAGPADAAWRAALEEHGKKLDALKATLGELREAIAKLQPPPPPEVPFADRERIFTEVAREAVELAEVAAAAAKRDMNTKLSGREKQREALAHAKARIAAQGFDVPPPVVRELALKIEAEVNRRKVTP